MSTKKQAFTVGLISENPNDTSALLALLHQQYAGRFSSTVLIKARRGDRLATPKAYRMLAAECERKKLHLVVYIRDLDALASNKEKMRERQQEFAEIQRVVGQDALFLLHIYQFEALLMADIATFNQQYKVSVPARGNPMLVENPKRKLIAASDKFKAARQYHENDSAGLAAKLDYAKLLKVCDYFREFDAAFAAKLPK